MKVICIDASTLTGNPHYFLVEGHSYETTGEAKNLDGDDCYIIPSSGAPSYCHRAKQFNSLPVYKKTRFIPLSTIDETELLEQRQEQLTLIK